MFIELPERGSVRKRNRAGVVAPAAAVKSTPPLIFLRYISRDLKKGRKIIPVA